MNPARLNDQEIENCENLPIDHFTKISEIGEGAYGTVALYNYEPPGCLVEQRAVKLLYSDDSDSETDKEEFEKELRKELLAFLHLEHENLVRFYGLVKVSVFPAIVMEYMEGGNLKEVLHPKEQAPYEYTLKDVLNWSIQSARALEYMHSKVFNEVDNQKGYPRFIHRDIKPANLLLDKDYQILKIGDFGFSKSIESSSSNTNLGTPVYKAPEVFNGEPYNETADVYSWTLTFWECLTGVEPFKDCSVTQLPIRKQQANHLADVNTASKKFNKIIQCGSKVDRNRLSMSSWRKLLETLYDNCIDGDSVESNEQRIAQANTICVWNDKQFFYCDQLNEFDWAAFDGNLAAFENALASL